MEFAMPNTELYNLTIEELSPLLRNKTVSPVEIVEDYLARIELLCERTIAYISIIDEHSVNALIGKHIDGHHLNMPIPPLACAKSAANGVGSPRAL